MAEEASDEDLVVAFKRGDVRAYDMLFRRYQAPVFNYVSRMVGSRQAGEDLAQETFYKAFVALGRTRTETHFRAWLYRIATNAAISHLRRRGGQSVSLDGGEDPPEVPATDTSDDPEASQLRRETAEVVHRVLRLLPDSYRQILLLRDHHGLSYLEIGEVMGLSVEAVTSLLFRARREFRQRYLEAAVPPGLGR